MKKRKNVIISAITCLFSICLMMFGVYAASNPSVSISGQVSYTARDASVLVQGKVDESGVGLLESDFVTAPATKDFSSLEKVTSGKNYLDWTMGESYDKDTDNFADWKDLNLNFYEDSNGVKDITIGFYMTNYSNYPVQATITMQKEIENVTVDKMTQIVKLDTFQQNPSSKLATIVLTLDNDSIPVNSADLSITVEFGRYVPVPTTEGWEYTTDDINNTCEITAYTGTEKDVIMPTTLTKDGKSYTVTSVKQNEYWGSPQNPNTIVESLTVANTVKKIGQFSFAEWTSLKQVLIPNGVETVDNYAFQNCSSLSSIELPDSVKYLGVSVFHQCEKLTTAKLPKEIIADANNNNCDFWYLFESCTNLKTVSLPQNANVLANTFTGCTSLETVEIPSQVKQLTGTFVGCTSLKNIIIPGSVGVLGGDSVAQNPFSNACTSLKNVVLGEGITTIKKSVFSDLTGLEQITLPSTLHTIEDFAFNKCSSLKSVTIPTNIETIGKSVFLDCSALTTVNLPEGMTSLPSGMFGGCTSLEAIQIPATVTELGSTAFGRCGFTSFTIPNTVTKIGDRTFGDCKKLTSISIPESVKTIGDGAFSYCDALTSITLPNSLTSLGGESARFDGLFLGCDGLKNEQNLDGNAYYVGSTSNPHMVLIAAKDETITECTINANTKIIDGWAFNGCSKLQAITIPEGVASIGDCAFNGCKLLTSVVMADSVTTYGRGVFSNCTALKNDNYLKDNIYYIGSASNPYIVMLGIKDATVSSIAINAKTKFIGNGAISGCTNLTTLEIPESVQSMGENAIYSCTKLQTIIIRATTPPKTQNPIYRCSKLTTIKVPSASLAAYQNSYDWSGHKRYFKSI